MSVTKKKKETKEESNTTDKNISNNTNKDINSLREELIADIVSVESIKNSGKGREPKYANLATAIKIIAKMSRNAYKLNLRKCSN